MDMPITQSELEIKNSKCLCVECQKVFSKPSNLKMHIKRKHPDKVDVVNQVKVYVCDECGEQITSKTKLKIHQRSHHSMNSQVINNSYYVCPICNFKETKVNLITHFNEKHDIHVIYENLEFSTMEDFISWKSKLETENAIKFVKKRGTHQGNKVTNINFYCHRFGKFHNVGSGKRHTKLQGSCKINGFCPAELKVKIRKDQCQVVYCKTHVGHTLDLEHINLSSKERKNIAEKIASQIPFSDILNEVHDSVTNCKLERLHLLNRKDLYNIEQSFKLNDLSVRHQNDAISVEAWANDEQHNNNSVLFYKAQDTLSGEYNFLIKDFVLNTIKDEEIKIIEAISKQKINEGTLENEVAQYLKDFVTNIVENIKTYEEFDVLKKLLDKVQPTLAAMKNNSGLLPKGVKNVSTNKKMVPQRRFFSVTKNRKR